MDMLVSSDGQTIRTEARCPEAGEVVWIHLDNPDEPTLHHLLHDMYGLHPLAIEDAVQFGQRPKVDLYTHGQRPHGLVSFYAASHELHAVEVCMLIGDNFFISITKTPIDRLSKLYQLTQEGGLSFDTPAVLLYRIIDGCVDSYVEAIDAVEERLDLMERAVFHDPQKEISPTVFRVKRRLHQLRRIAVDAQATVWKLKHESFPFVENRYEVYFEDVYDHALRATNTLDVVRDSLTSLLELQASQRGERMNQVMKTLATISTIFLPLSFIVGLYGMNFHDIPELSWHYGYLYVWILLISVGTGFIVYFKRKGWW